MSVKGFEYAHANGLLKAIPAERAAILAQESLTTRMDETVEAISRAILAGIGLRAAFSNPEMSFSVFAAAYGEHRRSQCHRAIIVGLILRVYSPSDISVANDPTHAAYLANSEAFRKGDSATRQALLKDLIAATKGGEIPAYDDVLQRVKYVIANQPSTKRKASVTEGEVTVTSNYSGSRTVTVSQGQIDWETFDMSQIPADVFMREGIARATGNTPDARAYRDAFGLIGRNIPARAMAAVTNVRSLFADDKVTA